jgi:hypothetical protein
MLGRAWRDERPDWFYIRDKTRLRFAFGHGIHEQMLRFFAPEHPCVLFTGLREPRSRLASAVSYARKRAEHFGRRFDEVGYLRDRGNEMCRRIVTSFPSLSGPLAQPLAERAILALQEFQYVYFHDSINASTRPLLDSLGIDTQLPRLNSGDVAEISNISDDMIRQDLQLYEWACHTWHGKTQFAEQSQRLRHWCSLPPDFQKLRKFLHGYKIDYFRARNNLSVVARAVEKAAKEMALEAAVLNAGLASSPEQDKETTAMRSLARR